MAALKQVQDELVAAGYLKPPAEAALVAKAAAKGRKATAKGKGGGKGANGGGSAPSAAPGGGPGFRQFTSPGGFQVLVGRNNIQNDQLSIKVRRLAGTEGAQLWLGQQNRLPRG